MAKICIKGGRVWNGERFLFTDILTDGNSIVKIEPSISEEADFVYDATGKTVSAGLVDAHVHMRRRSSNETFGVQAEISSFPFGVTAVADAGGAGTDRAFLDSFMLKNVLFVGACVENNQFDSGKTEQKLALYGDKIVGLKVYLDTTVANYPDVAILREICDFAHERGLRVMVHCTNSPDKMAEILRTLGPGDVLTHAFHGGIHNASEDNFESMKQAQKRGVVIDTGFAGNVHVDFNIFGQAIRNGVIPDTISTDITKFSAYTRGGRYGMTMCMNIAKTLGMTDEDIFKAVTSTPAKVLGKADEWGYLEIGRNADIAVFDYTNEGFDITDNAGNRICSTEGYRCVLTVVDSQVVYRD